VRAHIILPDRLVEEVDEVVGKRKRSHFVEEAIREKLKRGALVKALKETAGALPAKEYPEWETRDKAAAWVSESRGRDGERLGRPSGG
jgi:Arc/MetJ-type ribon-helix-helix transcriptional regulator